MTTNIHPNWKLDARSLPDHVYEHRFKLNDNEFLAQYFVDEKEIYFYKLHDSKHITANWKEYLGKYNDPIITTTEILTFNTSRLINFFQLLGG